MRSNGQAFKSQRGEQKIGRNVVASVSSVFSVAKNLRNPKSLAYSLPAVAGHYLAELLC